MAAKRDATAEHGEAQHVVADEAEQNGAAMAGRGNFREQGDNTCERRGEDATAWIATVHSSEVNRLRNSETEIS